MKGDDLRRSVAALCVTACAFSGASCGTPEPATAAATEETVMADHVASLPTRSVCVEQPDGTLRFARVRATIGGLHDSTTPLLLANLNWTAVDEASRRAATGCVSYGDASARRVACGPPGEPPAPVVSRTACQR